MKNFILASLAGFIVYWLLGWLFYGILFTNLYPNNGSENLAFVTLGCLIFAFLIGYLFTCFSSVTNLMTGLKVGALFGFLNSLSMNFFMYSSMPLNIQNFITDVAIGTISVGLTGAIIAFVHGKLNANTN